MKRIQLSDSRNTFVKGMFFSALLALALCLFPASGLAQIAGTGSIQGTISDPTGAVLPNATVTITNDATQAKHSAVTGNNGLYSFPNINIGTYTLTATAQGFKTYSQRNVILEVGSSISINVSMPVGAANE